MHLSCEVVETSQSTPGENKGYIRAILLPTALHRVAQRCCRPSHRLALHPLLISAAAVLSLLGLF